MTSPTTISVAPEVLLRAARALSAATRYDEALALLPRPIRFRTQMSTLRRMATAEIIGRRDYTRARRSTGAPLPLDEVATVGDREAWDVAMHRFRTSYADQLRRADGSLWFGPEGRDPGVRADSAERLSGSATRRPTTYAAAGRRCAWVGSATTSTATATERPRTTSTVWKPAARQTTRCWCSRRSAISATTTTTGAITTARGSDGRSRPPRRPGQDASPACWPSSSCSPCSRRRGGRGGRATPRHRGTSLGRGDRGRADRPSERGLPGRRRSDQAARGGADGRIVTRRVRGCGAAAPTGRSRSPRASRTR